MPTKQLLHVDLDAFFASVEQMLDPRLQGLPVIVGGQPGTRGVVASSSYEARTRGVKTAMPLSHAYRICPEAVFLPGRYYHYKAASDQFFNILNDFTPDVEPFSMDEAWLDLTGFEPHYGPTATTARRIKQRIYDEIGITASVGIATNKVVAKVASEQNKPNGLVEVAPGHEAAFLAPLPVRELPMVGEKVEAKLQRHRVYTIGELAALSPAFLLSLFGVTGHLLHNLSNGRDGAVVQSAEAEPPAKSVSRSTTLAEDTLDRKRLYGLLYYLSERVAAELRNMERQARCPVLKLRYADFHTISRNRTLSDPADDQQTLYRVTVELLEEALAERTEAVRLIGVGAQNLVDTSRQLRLFDPAYLKAYRINRAVDGLRDRYGFPAVQQGRTFHLNGDFPQEREGFVLKTPSLSR